MQCIQIKVLVTGAPTYRLNTNQTKKNSQSFASIMSLVGKLKSMISVINKLKTRLKYSYVNLI